MREIENIVVPFFSSLSPTWEHRAPLQDNAVAPQQPPAGLPG